MLDVHAAFRLRERAPRVHYSGRTLFQELRRDHGHPASYETVKLLVRPPRAVRAQTDWAVTRFETPPGWQSQVDKGHAQVDFRTGRVTQHFFVLTLAYSRRSFYCAFPNEQMAQFLEIRERAFNHRCHGMAELMGNVRRLMDVVQPFLSHLQALAHV